MAPDHRQSPHALSPANQRMQCCNRQNLLSACNSAWRRQLTGCPSEKSVAWTGLRQMAYGRARRARQANVHEPAPHAVLRRKLSG